MLYANSARFLQSDGRYWSREIVCEFASSSKVRAILTECLWQFVNSIVGGSVAKVEDTLESSTTDVAQYAYTHRSGTEVRVFDTPGFNDYKEGGSKTDLKVLQMIAAFLKKE